MILNDIFIIHTLEFAEWNFNESISLNSYILLIGNIMRTSMYEVFDNYRCNVLSTLRDEIYNVILTFYF